MSSASETHRYFVAEVVGVQDEGKVFVLIVCTGCGDFQCKEVVVGAKGSALRLMREERGR